MKKRKENQKNMNNVYYCPVIIPDRADCVNDRVSAEKIQEVAEGYMQNWQRVDKDHCLYNQTCTGKEDDIAHPVESLILKENRIVTDLQGMTHDLPAGTWVLGLEITNDEVLKKIENGEYKGVSLMAKRTDTIAKANSLREFSDWTVTSVSVVKDPCVQDACFIQNFKGDEKMAEEENTMINEDTLFEKIKQFVINIVNEMKEKEESDNSIAKEEKSEKEDEKEDKDEKENNEFIEKVKELTERVEALEQRIKNIEDNKKEDKEEEKEEEKEKVAKSRGLHSCSCTQKACSYGDFEDRDAFGRRI